MRRTIFDLFAKSPFGPLQDHLAKVMVCVRLIPDFFRAVEKGDKEQIAAITEKVEKAEFEADQIKNQIRLDLPSTIFTPVNRADLLEILSLQDRVSDVAEDVVVLYRMKNIPLPELIRELFWKFLDQVMLTAEQYAKISGELDELVEASFGGAEAGKMVEMISSLSEMEHEADILQHALLYKLLTLEEELGALNIVLWMRVFQCVGDIANGAEKVGNRLRLFLSK
ncbi:MAG: TIGR00153 family protein [Candidatus Deferrimicrobiaceae bacterium]|jgi:predicted phosphate transport protein (TIGR00153 family)